MNDLPIDLQIQMLADGELGHDERSELLKSMEHHPQRWQQLALAFVDNQVVQEAIRQPAITEPIHTNLRRDSASSVKRQRGRFIRGWLAMAVCLSIGLLSGMWIPGDESNTTQPGAMSQSDDRTPAATEAARLTPTSLEDAISRSTSPIPIRFRRQLLQAGYVVNERQTNETVELPIGGSIDIPVRQVQIQYLGLAAYQ